MLYVNLYIKVNSGMYLDDKQKIMHNIRNQLKAHFKGIVDVVVHIDPKSELIEG